MPIDSTANLEDIPSAERAAMLWEERLVSDGRESSRLTQPPHRFEEPGKQVVRAATCPVLT